MMEKWPFLDQNRRLPLWKKINFSTFWTSCFYSLERRFFVLEYSKRHFPCLYCLKKKCWKNGHFWTKTMSYPIWKYVNFSTFRTFCFSTLERCFLVLEYRKRHFPCLYCPKKKNWKDGHFWTKNHGLTPLKKCQFFVVLNFLFL